MLKSPQSRRESAGDDGRLARVRSFHDDEARDYTCQRYGTETVTQLSYLTRREMALRMLKGVEGAVLDVGCGPGPFLEGLAGEGRTLFLADVSVEMLREARGRRSACRAGAVHYLVADLDRLGVKAESFDGVNCIGVIGYVPDPATAIREVRRVLRRGGSAVIQTTNAWGVKYRVYEWWLPRIKAWLGLRPSGGRTPTGLRLHAHSRRAFRLLMQEAGLQVVGEEFYDFHVPFLERLNRTLAVGVARWLQRFSRSWVGLFLGSGLVVSVVRAAHE